MKRVADVIIVGAGLAGIVAATELADAGKSVLLLDQEAEQNLGGQAFWSLGGLFLVDSKEQRRLGIKDSHELASRDWLLTAGFDRAEDRWPKKWAEAYLAFAAEEKKYYLNSLGIRFFPAVGWAERGRGDSNSAGNSVPRFHLTWGTGPGVLEPFIKRLRSHQLTGNIHIKFRHRVTELVMQNNCVVAVQGDVLEPTQVARGVASSRAAVNQFEFAAAAVVIASGGIGGNHKLVREYWPTERLGPAPEFMLSGVPQHVDGKLQVAVGRIGGNLINRDRMWHYTEGLRNWNPIWQNHGIRVLPGPSSLWLDPYGNRLPYPYYPGFDTLGTLAHITTHRFPYTWFLLNRTIIKKEFALSGSEQNPDLTGRSYRLTLKRIGKNVQAPVQAFMDQGEDFVIESTLKDLVRGMNKLIGNNLVDYETILREVTSRDLQVLSHAGKDSQLAFIKAARSLMSERLFRIAKPKPLLDRSNGPLIAVRMNILTRKSLGGLETDLQARVLNKEGQPIVGLYAIGEVAGFGGGGMHGYRALEGTFLGGCIFTGLQAARALTKAIG